MVISGQVTEIWMNVQILSFLAHCGPVAEPGSTITLEELKAVREDSGTGGIFS